MFRMRMEIAGEVQMDRGIARFADGVADYRPIWPVIVDDFHAMEKEQFQTEGAEGGDQWQPLSESYGAWKAAAYPGQPILQRSGDLYRSLTKEGDANAVDVRERKSITLGSRVGYGLFHQVGAGLPQRRPVQFNEAWKRSMMHHIQTYLVQIASASGFRTGMGPLDAARLGAFRARTSTPGGRQRDSRGRFTGA